MYNAPDRGDWLCATAAAEIVQAMVPDTCRVVVNESERQPRRRRGYDSTVAAVGSLPQETASACAALNEGYIILVMLICLFSTNPHPLTPNPHQGAQEGVSYVSTDGGSLTSGELPAPGPAPEVTALTAG